MLRGDVDGVGFSAGLGSTIVGIYIDRKEVVCWVNLIGILLLWDILSGQSTYVPCLKAQYHFAFSSLFYRCSSVLVRYIVEVFRIRRDGFRAKLFPRLHSAETVIRVTLFISTEIISGIYFASTFHFFDGLGARWR